MFRNLIAIYGLGFALVGWILFFLGLYNLAIFAFLVAILLSTTILTVGD